MRQNQKSRPACHERFAVLTVTSKKKSAFKTKPLFIASLLAAQIVTSLVATEAVFATARDHHEHRDGRSPATAPQRPDSERILKARALAAEGKLAEAEKTLADAIDDEKDRDRRALLRLALAMIEFQAGEAAPVAPTGGSAENTNRAKAETQFTKALEDGVRVPDYAHFYLGLLKRKSNRNTEAVAEFGKVVNARTSKAAEMDARSQMAAIHLQDKQWSAARTQLETLRRNLKNDERYSGILFGLLRADLHSGRKAQACKWARELFAKYPALPDLKEWGPHLESNSIDGVRLGCAAAGKELKTRIRRLWLGGEPDRAMAELKQLKDETDDDGNSLVESLTINQQIADGRVDEALKSLLARYETSKNHPSYLLLLAKAAASAGDYQAAVSAYSRAFDLAPRGKNGVNALYQAAFTSYQMQDYDGASRRFEKLISLNRSSRQAREAQWYVAWMRYLRGDYQGAAEKFKAFSLAPHRVGQRLGRHRGRRVVISSESGSRERMNYWQAMSLLRMGKQKEAIPIFQDLARDPAIGYYGILAYYRLTSLGTGLVPNGVESRLGGPKGANEALAHSSDAEIKLAAAAASENSDVDYDGAGDDAGGDDRADGPSETVDASDQLESGASLPPETVPTFRDVGLAQRFERVRDLTIVGIEDGARRELREIEKRARSVEDRKLLMAEFVNVKNFERSSYLGEIGFGRERLVGGLRGSGRIFWENAYPRAWEPAVVQASRATSVPEELIWGIMRAESRFRFDAQSPVGALGLMQLMPFTSRKVADLMNLKSFDTRSLLDPETNIKLGSRYLQRLIEKFGAKVPLVAGAYNAGPHRVFAWVRNFGALEMDEFIEHIPYTETRNYVKRVSRNFQIYRLLYGDGSRDAGAGTGGVETASAETAAQKTLMNLQAMRWLIQPVGAQVGESAPVREVW